MMPPRFHNGRDVDLPKWRFLVLCEILGSYKAASDIIDQLVVWPERTGKPPAETLRRWVFELERGRMEIPGEVRAQMEKQVKAYMEYALLTVAVKNAEAARTLADKFLRTGDLSDQEAKLLTRFNNAAGFVAGTVRGGKQPQPETKGGLKINAGPKRPKKAGENEPIDIRSHGNG